MLSVGPNLDIVAITEHSIKHVSKAAAVRFGALTLSYQPMSHFITTISYHIVPLRWLVLTSTA